MTHDEYSEVEGVAFINGSYLPLAEAKLSVIDLGFFRSDAVYDVTSTWHGMFFRLDDHVERLLRSCEGVRIPCPYDANEIKQILAECVDRAGLDDAYVNVTITRGFLFRGGGRGSDIRKAKPNFIAYAMPYVWTVSPKRQESGVNVVIASNPRIPDVAVDARYKNYHWGDLTRAQIEAYDRGAYTSVLCSIDGFLSEGPGFNVFFVKDGTLFTPARNVLEGITRQSAIDLAKEIGVQVELGDYKPDDLMGADEVFITTTAGGIMPVTEVEEKPIGNGVPGELTKKLKDLYWSKREAGWHGTKVSDLVGARHADAG